MRGQGLPEGAGAGDGVTTKEPRPVLVVDLGAQYAQLIARRVRECHVYSEIVPHDLPVAELKAKRPAGIVLSGGPASVYEEGAPVVDPEVFRLGVPVLGICYGQQLMTQALGGEVRATGLREYGRTSLSVDEPGVLLEDLGREETVWMSHGDTVVRAPEGFRVTAHTESTPVAAMEDRERGLFGVQFHPEVAHTPRGPDIMKRFLYEGCGLLPDWTPANVIERSVARIREQVGDGKVVCALSGGVDSSVAALLVYKAVGDRLACVFVDTGLLREDEPEQVEDTFSRHFHVPLVHVKAADRFLARLGGVTDPEEKRKAIGEEFIRVFEEAAAPIGARFLVQGTLYPDVIESGSRTAARIKSHHNVAGLPEEMEFELVEPLRDLFKDEVREVGEELGLPEEIVWRQPFPGPGLAVRIVGEVTPERLEIVRAADRIVQEEVRRAGLHHELWQVFAVLLGDVRSVGVMGDGRTYHHPIVIRAVTSEDAMTADWARLPHEVLDRISGRIIAEVPRVNRVAYDVSSKPPATIEWE
ncbi:MAG: glutamine-hydrolyzing GMP synthase [Actinobacteria bacterium]|nr:glutamine-hydrolyzing GMP synthase [Actinomycetota bacterium]